MRLIGFLFLAMLALLWLTGCSGGGSAGTPLSQLVESEASLLSEGQVLLEEAVTAFQDLIPQELIGQATGSPRLLTIVGDEPDNTVLIGGPWRPPFPWPLPPVNKPLFVVIKKPSCPGGCRPAAHLAFLRQEAEGTYSLEWYGARGTASVKVPARMEQLGNLEEPINRQMIEVKFSYNRKGDEWEVDIIIVLGANQGIHIVAPLPPETLSGRPLSQTTTFSESYRERFKTICCGIPKPKPPLWPNIWLSREDVSAVAVSYDDAQLNSATVEELVGKDLGFIFIRKKPWPGPTTDCGPNGVWCPPEQLPFYNMRLIRSGQEFRLELRRLGNPPSDVVAALPVQVRLAEEPGSVGIVDDLNEPDHPSLRLKLPRISIVIIIKIGRQ